jgi:hypothetical protein
MKPGALLQKQTPSTQASQPHPTSVNYTTRQWNTALAVTVGQLSTQQRWPQQHLVDNLSIPC